MARIEVGRFSLDGDELTGPATNGAVFRYGAAGASPSVEVALLVALQTDYAAFDGARRLPFMDANSANPLEASIARLRGEES